MRFSEITAVILTRDEARNLPRALDSLPDEMPVLVLDAESCDRTQEFALAHGARVIERPWNGFVEARRFALDQVPTPWTLAIDADETLDDRLREAIGNADESVEAYALSRDTYFCGKPLRMWRGERLLRLFRTGRARIETQAASGDGADVHEGYVCDGPAGELGGTLLHFSYPDLASYRVKYDRYTTLEARGADARRFDPIGPLLRLLYLLFVRGALLDGWRGIYVAWKSAVYPLVVAFKAGRR